MNNRLIPFVYLSALVFSVNLLAAQPECKFNPGAIKNMVGRPLFESKLLGTDLHEVVRNIADKLVNHLEEVQAKCKFDPTTIRNMVGRPLLESDRLDKELHPTVRKIVDDLIDHLKSEGFKS